MLKLGCPKINLQIRLDNLEAVEFYRRLGYETFDVIDMGKRLIPDRGFGALHRNVRGSKFDLKLKLHTFVTVTTGSEPSVGVPG